jgi:hypothetical protein
MIVSGASNLLEETEALNSVLLAVIGWDVIQSEVPVADFVSPISRDSRPPHSQSRFMNMPACLPSSKFTIFWINLFQTLKFCQVNPS